MTPERFSIGFAVDSIADPRAFGPQLASWLERLRTTLLPAVLRAVGTGGSWPRARSQTAFLSANTLSVSIAAHRRGASGSRYSAGTDRTWARLVDETSQALISDATLTIIRTGDTLLDADLPIAMHLWLARGQVRASHIALSLSASVADSLGLASVQDELVVLMRELCAATSACFGRMGIDQPPDYTAYESDIGRDDGKGIMECAEWARGFDWGTALSTTHVERLGGIGRIRSEAPVARVDDWSEGSLSRVFLQATNGIEALTPEIATRLREYLRPALVS